MNNLIPFFLILLAFMPIRLLAQGCSDAGACSIPAMQYTDPFNKPEKKNSFYLGLNAGSADHNIIASGAHAGFSRMFGTAFSVDAKLTFAVRNGNDINTCGLGDAYAIINYRISPYFTASAGVKLPLSEANKTFEGRMLPMDYQISLGTPDVIVGVSYNKNNWLLSLAYQQPLDQNQNVFIPSEWPAESTLSEFQQTGVYHRSSDILMRIGRVIPLHDRLTITPGLLPIYHLRSDYDYLTFERVEIDGSAGLTLNATLQATIQSGLHNQIQLSIGFPLIVREVRPDGLTRSFVAGLDYLIAF